MRERVSYGVSVDPDEAEKIDSRVAALKKQFGVKVSRSAYFEMLARYDRKEKVIERIFATPQPQP